jgi:hypothetical protein
MKIRYRFPDVDGPTTADVDSDVAPAVGDRVEFDVLSDTYAVARVTHRPDAHIIEVALTREH